MFVVIGMELVGNCLYFVLVYSYVVMDEGREFVFDLCFGGMSGFIWSFWVFCGEGDKVG